MSSKNKKIGIEFTSVGASKYIANMMKINQQTKELNKNQADLVKKLREFDEQMKRTGKGNGFSAPLKSAGDMRLEIERLQKALDGMDKSTPSFKQTEDELKKIVDQLDAYNKALADSARQSKTSGDSYNGLTQKLKSLKELYKQLPEDARRSTSGLNLAGDIKETTAEIKKINDELKNFGSKSNKKIETVSNSIKELRERSKDLKKELENVDKSSPEFNKLQSDLSKVNREIKDYSDELRASTKAAGVAKGSYTDLTTQLNKLRATYKNLSEEARDGGIGQGLLENINQLDGRLKSIDADIGNYQRNVGNYSSIWQNAGSIVAGVAGGVMIAAVSEIGQRTVEFAQESSLAFSEYQNSISSVNTLLSDLSVEEQKEIEENLRSFNAEVARTSDETIPALYQALSASIPEDNVFAFLETASDVSLAGTVGDQVVELEQSVGLLSGLMNSFGQENLAAGEAADILFSVVENGVTTVGELEASMKDLPAVAKSANVEWADLGAQIATMTSQTGQTSESITQIKNLLNELKDTGGQAGKTFEEIAGKSFVDFTASGGTVLDALQLMEGYAGETSVSIDQLFSSAEAGSAALLLSGDSAEIYAQNLEETQNAAGNLDRAVSQFADNQANLRRELAQSTEELQLQIGEALEPSTTAWIKFRIEANKSAGEALSAIQKYGGGSIEVLGVIGKAFDEIKLKVTGTLDDISGGFGEEIVDTLGGIVDPLGALTDKAKDIGETFGKDAAEGVGSFISNSYDAFNAAGDLNEQLREQEIDVDAVHEAFGEAFSDLGRVERTEERLLAMRTATKLLNEGFEGTAEELAELAIASNTGFDRLVNAAEEAPQSVNELGTAVVDLTQSVVDLSTSADENSDVMERAEFTNQAVAASITELGINALTSVDALNANANASLEAAIAKEYLNQAEQKLAGQIAGGIPASENQLNQLKNLKADALEAANAVLILRDAQLAEVASRAGEKAAVLSRASGGSSADQRLASAQAIEEALKTASEKGVSEGMASGASKGKTEAEREFEKLSNTLDKAFTDVQEEQIKRSEKIADINIDQSRSVRDERIGYERDVADARRDFAEDNAKIELEAARQLAEAQLDHERNIADTALELRREGEDDARELGRDIRDEREAAAKEVAETEKETLADISEARKETEDEIKELRQDHAGDSRDLDIAYNNDIEDARKETENNIAEARESASRKAAQLELEFSRKETELELDKSRKFRDIDNDLKNAIKKNNDDVDLKITEAEKKNDDEVAAAQIKAHEDNKKIQEKLDDDITAHEKKNDENVAKLKQKYEKDVAKARTDNDKKITTAEQTRDRAISKNEEAEKRAISKLEDGLDNKITDLQTKRDREVASARQARDKATTKAEEKLEKDLSDEKDRLDKEISKLEDKRDEDIDKAKAKRAKDLAKLQTKLDEDIEKERIASAERVHELEKDLARERAEASRDFNRQQSGREADIRDEVSDDEFDLDKAIEERRSYATDAARDAGASAEESSDLDVALGQTTQEAADTATALRELEEANRAVGEAVESGKLSVEEAAEVVEELEAATRAGESVDDVLDEYGLARKTQAEYVLEQTIDTLNAIEEENRLSEERITKMKTQAEKDRKAIRQEYREAEKAANDTFRAEEAAADAQYQENKTAIETKAEENRQAIKQTFREAEKAANDALLLAEADARLALSRRIEEIEKDAAYKREEIRSDTNYKLYQLDIELTDKLKTLDNEYAAGKKLLEDQLQVDINALRDTAKNDYLERLNELVDEELTIRGKLQGEIDKIEEAGRIKQKELEDDALLKRGEAVQAFNDAKYDAEVVLNNKITDLTNDTEYNINKIRSEAIGERNKLDEAYKKDRETLDAELKEEIENLEGELAIEIEQITTASVAALEKIKTESEDRIKQLRQDSLDKQEDATIEYNRKIEDHEKDLARKINDIEVDKRNKKYDNQVELGNDLLELETGLNEKIEDISVNTQDKIQDAYKDTARESERMERAVSKAFQDASSSGNKLEKQLDTLQKQLDKLAEGVDIPITQNGEVSSPQPGSFYKGGRYGRGDYMMVGDGPGGRFIPGITELMVADRSGLVIPNNAIQTAVNVLRHDDSLRRSIGAEAQPVNHIVYNNNQQTTIHSEDQRQYSPVINGRFANPLNDLLADLNFMLVGEGGI